MKLLPSAVSQLKRFSAKTKINSVSELEDTPAVRGMINKVSYLVKVIG
ncbi:MAG: hypothetical protein B7Y22_04405 [Polynucleobacter sp. 16-46-70]|nr:MAG: hypothetical protein B7Y22_04405 [Polynucleobacter sp. 16-46-70]